MLTAETEKWQVCRDCNTILMYRVYGVSSWEFDHDSRVAAALETHAEGDTLTLEKVDEEEFSRYSCDCCLSGLAGPRFGWNLTTESE